MSNTQEIYHYTSLQGFKGITTDASLRMTKSTFLNDPDDCTLFSSLIEKYIHDNNIACNPDKLFGNPMNIPHMADIKRLFKAKCDPISYIQFIQHSIPLYVISFSKSHDSIPMWKCYGKDGMELKFNRRTLLEALQANLKDNEYLIASDVIYTNKETSLNTIKLASEFSEIMLIDKDNYHIFDKHKTSKDKLYSTTKIDEFIKTYIKNYIFILSSLLSENKIKVVPGSINPADIFNDVFDNSMSPDSELWKHDLALYLVVLSALVKHDSYENEKEHRIVYFECNTSRKKIRKEEHEIKQMASGNFLYPYINLFSSRDSGKPENTEDTPFQDSLKEITLSPLSCNLPINFAEYQIALESFLEDNKYKNVKANNSTHNIRW